LKEVKEEIAEEFNKIKKEYDEYDQLLKFDSKTDDTMEDLQPQE
jgi:sulfur transfer protein SufE